METNNKIIEDFARFWNNMDEATAKSVFFATAFLLIGIITMSWEAILKFVMPNLVNVAVYIIFLCVAIWGFCELHQYIFKPRSFKDILVEKRETKKQFLKGGQK